MSYEIHPNLSTPPDDTVLWRYLDFAKFVDVLERQVLWFARADTFEDPLEATYTDGELNHLHSLPAIPAPGAGTIADSYLRATKLARSTSFISCWRAGADESMAMWDLYRKGGGVIAIKSTVGRLKEAFTDYANPVFIGRVTYVDWRGAPWDNNLLAMCVHKVLAYKHESEVRALIWTPENLTRSSLGLEVPFDPRKFLTETLIGPREPEWVCTLARRVMARYGLSQPVVASTLLQPRS